MTTADEAMKALEGVTPGPWHWNVRGFIGPASTEDDQSYGMICDEVAECTFSNGSKEANARFIAWCREGVPALLADLAAKDAEIARLVHHLKAADDYIDRGHYEMARNITRAALKGDTP